MTACVIVRAFRYFNTGSHLESLTGYKRYSHYLYASHRTIDISLFSVCITAVLCCFVSKEKLAVTSLSNDRSSRSSLRQLVDFISASFRRSSSLPVFLLSARHAPICVYLVYLRPLPVISEDLFHVHHCCCFSTDFGPNFPQIL